MKTRFIIFLLVSLAALMLSLEAFGCSKFVVKPGVDYQKAFASANTKYVIKQDINLQGKMVKIGEGSTLVFQGGSLANGTIVGNQTKITDTRDNIFRDCRIDGTWILRDSYSSFFNADLDALLLIKNLSCLSQNIKLSPDRTYRLASQGEVIQAESISSIGKEKAIIDFHTTNPNVVGLMISGNNIVLNNLSIRDDYDKSNDSRFGKNDITIGSTIGIQSKKKIVNSLTVNGCDFSGGTSSSFIASSQVLECSVNNCTFSGYMADHAVYCSTQIRKFSVQNCIINDVTNTAGLFKIRASKDLEMLSLKNIDAINLNGYIVIASLLETPYAQLLFDNITVTKDDKDKSVFFGFCITDETKSLENTGRYNAGRATISNCRFDYGYNGASLLYQGSGRRACIKTIEYRNTKANYSNFAGAFSDVLSVEGCQFTNCLAKGLPINTRKLSIEKTSLSQTGNGRINYVFSCFPHIFGPLTRTGPTVA